MQVKSAALAVVEGRVDEGASLDIMGSGIKAANEMRAATCVCVGGGLRRGAQGSDLDYIPLHRLRLWSEPTPEVPKRSSASCRDLEHRLQPEPERQQIVQIRLLGALCRANIRLIELPAGQ